MRAMMGHTVIRRLALVAGVVLAVAAFVFAMARAS
jgi:hypothetical protein